MCVCVCVEVYLVFAGLYKLELPFVSSKATKKKKKIDILLVKIYEILSNAVYFMILLNFVLCVSVDNQKIILGSFLEICRGSSSVFVVLLNAAIKCLQRLD